MEEANMSAAEKFEKEKDPRKAETIIEAIDNQNDLNEEIKDFFTKIDYDQEKQDKWCNILGI